MCQIPVLCVGWRRDTFEDPGNRSLPKRESGERIVLYWGEVV